MYRDSSVHTSKSNQDPRDREFSIKEDTPNIPCEKEEERTRRKNKFVRHPAYLAGGCVDVSAWKGV